MATTVRVQLPPLAPFWFENIQIVSQYYPAPGPNLPRGIGR